MPSLIADWLDYTEAQESPKQFHFWSAVSTIATLLGRRVWLDMQMFTVYPCHYIVLVAGSAMCRKRIPMDTAVDFLDAVHADINHISEKISSAEALCYFLDRGVYTEGTSEEIELFSKTAYVQADEFDVLLSPTAIASGICGVLNTLYGCRPQFRYDTKTQGEYCIPKPCLNILAGTTPEWIGRSIDPRIISEGMLGRFVWVYASQRDHANDLLDPLPDRKPLAKSIIEQLDVINHYTGEMFLTDEAKYEVLRPYYVSIRESDDPKVNGFVGRQYEHVLKLSMILAVSSCTFPHITAHDARVAIEMIDRIRLGIPDILQSTNRQLNETEGRANVLFIIQKNGTIDHSKLLRRAYGRGVKNALDVKDAIAAGLEMGLIGRKIAGRQTSYYWIGERKDGNDQKRRD